ncbi:MAG: NTP transferase domain-containing protein [Acidobacteriia bacterium]|nr:NTP transferase domain-containing protein [Terriglobia bacterium]
MLTAGLGTRLRPLTDVRAKPALPVAGEPLIRRIIAWLAAQGVRDLVLNLHHLPETIAAVVGDGADLDARVRYSWEQPRVLGSAGGPRLALPLIGADTFLIVNGDTLTDLALAPMIEAHAASGALVTLALVPNREFDRYGGVALDDRQRVTSFPRRGPAAKGSHHFIGVQVVHASAFAALIPGEPASSIGGAYDALIAARPGAVRGFVCDAKFWDVGTPADYWRTSQAFLADPGAGSPTGRNARTDPSARITRSILWDDVEVGAGAVIDECIVTDRVRVPAGASYRRSILIAREDAIVATPLNL